MWRFPFFIAGIETKTVAEIEKINAVFQDLSAR